jgi:hypothetical protein
MERIHVEFRKWDGSLHWHFDTVRLGEDSHGVWLGGHDGTPVRRGSEPPITSPPFAMVIPEGRWWTATFNPRLADAPFGYVAYIDICTPAVWDDAAVSSTDLDLDVAMRPDGVVELLDEDEFAEHRISMGYPGHVVDHARTAAAAIFKAMASGDEPFATVGQEWLGKAIDLRGEASGDWR